MKKILTILVLTMTILSVIGIVIANGQHEECKPSEADTTKVETCTSSPSLGIGFEGSVAGDEMPILYTYRVDGEMITAITKPMYPDGPVIVTPARTAGEPLQKIEMKDRGAKGARIAEWYANHNSNAVETEEPTEE